MPAQHKPKTKTRRTNISLDAVTRYADQVAAGKVKAGPYVRAAGARHLGDLRRRDLVWDRDAAERVIAYFLEVLTVEVEVRDEYGAVESRAVPFKLEPWQCFIVGSLFGWKRKNGLRRFRRSYTEVGKGNGKSPMAAGIGHYMLTATGKLRAEVYSAATDRDQAAILFRDAVAMWARSKDLKRRLVASGQNPTWQLTDLARASFFKPISSEKKGKSGIRPYCALIDEIHEHADNSVIEMLRAGTKGNQDALIFEITNSGFDRNSVCYFEHDYTVRVVTGVVDNDGWFGYIACCDPDDQPLEDESCWIKANPNLGVSIHPAYIREQVLEAKGMPTKEGYVRRLHFCEWTDAETAAIPRAKWVACLGDVDPATLAGIRPFGGLDLSRTRDLCAFTLTWITDQTLDAWRFVSRTWFWTPLDTLRDRARRDRAPYEEWAKAGYIEAVPGDRISYRWVAEALAGLCAEYDPAIIGCDQYGLEQLRDQLTELGVDLPCVVHPQGFNERVIDEKAEHSLLGATGAEKVKLWMPDAIIKLENAILERRITIEPNPQMSSCAAGVVYAQNRSGHRMFDKMKASHRIDGMVSLAMSIGVGTVRKEPKTIDLGGMIG